MDKICETDPYYTEMKRNKNEELMRTLVADGDYGHPLNCPCGGRIIYETTEEPPLGRRYLKCNKYKNDGLHLHIRKRWDIAIEEEVTMLRKEFDEKAKEGSFRLLDFNIKQLRREVQNNAQEIANLKDLVAMLVGRIENLGG